MAGTPSKKTRQAEPKSEAGGTGRRAQTRRPSPMPAERGANRDDRRKQILQAAVEVFAEKGYHGCRISDVAERAGVAYGLVYHYFGNKEGLLSSIFEANWSVFAKALEDVAAQETSTQDKVRQMVQFLLNAFEVNPLLVKVLVLEFGRSSRLGDALDDPNVSRVFSAVQRIFREGAEKGELSPDLDPRALTIVFLGALEASLASFVIPSPGDATSPAQPTSYVAMRDTLMQIVNRGFFLQKGKGPDQKPEQTVEKLEKKGGRKPRSRS